MLDDEEDKNVPFTSSDIAVLIGFMIRFQITFDP